MPLPDKSLICGPMMLSKDNFTHQMWGGRWIADLKHLTCQTPVGESWEFSALPKLPSRVRFPDQQDCLLPEVINAFPEQMLGRRVAARWRGQVPLLIKLIDAKDDLSLQVHPPDSGDVTGKSEAWV